MSDDKLTKTPDIFKPMRKSGIALQREQAREHMKNIDPQTVQNRLGLEFDDSGSMSGQPIQDAKDAVRNFLLNCNPRETSVALYPMNKPERELTCNYDLINLSLIGIEDHLGGTPLYTCLSNMLDANITRGVIFSDGSPTDTRPDPYSSQPILGGSTLKQDTINKAKQKEIPLDTIYIGYKDNPGYGEMKWIAEQTGGIFLHFTDSASLNRSLKYLSPGLRPMLMNAELKAKIEKGGTI